MIKINRFGSNFHSKFLWLHFGSSSPQPDLLCLCLTVYRRFDIVSEASGPDLLAADVQQVTCHLRFALIIQDDPKSPHLVYLDHCRKGCEESDRLCVCRGGRRGNNEL